MNRLLVTIAATALPLWALAETPKLSVVEVVHVKAPLDKVWATVKDFDSLDKWHPAVATDKLVSGTNNVPGAVRSLQVKDGPVIKEKLVAFDEAAHTFRYRMIDPPLPVAHYVSTVTVNAGAHDTTTVRWVGHFTRKNPADSPPEGETDAAAVKTITGIYRGGLDNLKKMLESH